MSRDLWTVKPGDDLEVHSGFGGRTRYPAKVDRVTGAQVHVTYDASSTGGKIAIRKSFWKKNGCTVGYRDGPRLSVPSADNG